MGDNERVYGWNPETGEQQIFANADARAEVGWLDHHPDDEAKGGVNNGGGDDDGKEPPLDRKEIIAALQEGGVEFHPKAKVAQLDAALRKALTDALTAAEREFDPNTSTRALLEMVRNPQAE